MKRFAAVLCAILLLCSCAKKPTQEPQDYNLKYLHIVLKQTDHFLLYQWQEGEEYPEMLTRELADEQHVAALIAQIQARLGGMTARPLQLQDLKEYDTIRFTPSLPIPDYEGATLYSLWPMSPFYTGGALHFVIDEKNTPAACMLEIEGNRVWYTFENPEEIVETYWLLAREQTE